jgi:ubiquinone/menaquinone biosynthesis C-methylase UbiE
VNSPTQSNSSVKYDNSQQEWDSVLQNPELKKMGDTWLREDTLDYWRHLRMRKPVNAFISSDPNGTWLTIGDGRYGTDAHYLLSAGAKQVHCSDISDTLLKIGNEVGFIQEFSAQNAEFLDFPDGAFDYVYCKEAFHHFPRPFIALSEMFRVAKKAVILCEPRDQMIDRARFSVIARFLKSLLGRSPDQYGFEEVGNFVYSPSERELEKFLLGMHHNLIAYTGCNDAYIPGVELIPINPITAADKKVASKIKSKIAIFDWMVKFGLMKTQLLTAALFKQTPSPEVQAALQAAGWGLKALPKNPYQ